MQQLKSRIEAVLFVTAKALSLEEISEYVEREPEECEEALLELIMDYSSRDGALEVDDEDGYILQVKEDYSDIVEKICPIDMSPAVLRTLLIIALKVLTLYHLFGFRCYGFLVLHFLYLILNLHIVSILCFQYYLFFLIQPLF